ILMRGSLAKTAFVRFSPRGFVTSSKRYLMERNTGAKYRLKDEDRSWFQACVADELDKIEADTMDCEMLTSLYSK
ncbi:MAG: hypothetical protein GY784_09010, partial [Gammaproteobacteria bacterium]|nr:hypothetical protein [Gammaproteobacteria bacterium]